MARPKSAQLAGVASSHRATSDRDELVLRRRDDGRPVVGVDVAKHRLDVAVQPSGETWSAAHDDAGITAVVARLRPLSPTLIVCEATGGFERAAIAALGAGLPVVVANPRQVRDFARATGQLAKNDQLDAGSVVYSIPIALSVSIRSLSSAQVAGVPTLPRFLIFSKAAIALDGGLTGGNSGVVGTGDCAARAARRECCRIDGPFPRHASFGSYGASADVAVCPQGYRGFESHPVRFSGPAFPKLLRIL